MNSVADKRLSLGGGKFPNRSNEPPALQHSCSSRLGWVVGASLRGSPKVCTFMTADGFAAGQVRHSPARRGARLLAVKPKQQSLISTDRRPNPFSTLLEIGQKHRERATVPTHSDLLSVVRGRFNWDDAWDDNYRLGRYGYRDSLAGFIEPDCYSGVTKDKRWSPHGGGTVAQPASPKRDMKSPAGPSERLRQVRVWTGIPLTRRAPNPIGMRC